jgi:hypothetical protein
MLKYNEKDFKYNDKKYVRYLKKRKLMLELNKANRARWNQNLRYLNYLSAKEVQDYQEELVLKRK